MDDKASLIASSKQEFNRWEEMLAGIPEDQIMAENRVGTMSIRGIVAHLTTWQQISVARLEAALSNKEPDLLKWTGGLDPDSEETLDQLNAWIQESRREQAWREVHKEWRERYRHFLELAEAIPEKDLFEVGRYAWLKEYPLSAVVLGSLEHHEEHREPLIARLHQE